MKAGKQHVMASAFALKLLKIVIAVAQPIQVRSTLKIVTFYVQIISVSQPGALHGFRFVQIGA